jgi:hypothetical protein
MVFVRIFFFFQKSRVKSRFRVLLKLFAGYDWASAKNKSSFQELFFLW